MQKHIHIHIHIYTCVHETKRTYSENTKNKMYTFKRIHTFKTASHILYNAMEQFVIVNEGKRMAHSLMSDI